MSTQRRAYMLRDRADNRVTLSRLITDTNRTFHILERPWLDNRNNVSCIPAGEYDCQFMARSGSGKYRNVYWLQAVPGRTGILIHNGNLVRHSRGCLIIGQRRGVLGGQPAVLASRDALRALVAEYDQEPFRLTIWGDQHV